MSRSHNNRKEISDSHPREEENNNNYYPKTLNLTLKSNIIYHFDVILAQSTHFDICQFNLLKVVTVWLFFVSDSILKQHQTDIAIWL